MKLIAFMLVLFTFTSCISVKEHNRRADTPVPAEKLKDDVDFAHRKLLQLHPRLYWYISKDSLDKKFDSLKSSITQPLKPNDFFCRLAPVISSVRQGHLRLYPYERRFTAKEIRHLKKQKGLLSRFNFITDGSQIFVKDNPDKIPNMNVGTEILSIKGMAVPELLAKYRSVINSDGYNTTFQRYSLSRRWPGLFTNEFGILDSVQVETRYGNERKSFYLYREKITTEEKIATDKQNRKITKSETGKTKDYNILTKSYNRDLQFPTNDSTIAYMKIKTFSGTYSRRFYRESFATLRKSPARYLILDVRDNLGGSLSEIHNLYSYLTPEPFKFIRDIEVTSRFSVLHADYFSEIPLLLKPLAAAGYPLYLLGSVLSVKKTDGRFYLRNNNPFTLKNPKKNHFSGKTYLLINGSSFSASSLLASKLKDARRAVLIGEETGGANDGTVAGRYSTEKLPHSKLKLPVGLMLVQPDIKITETKKGVEPDHEMNPTLLEILHKKDLMMDWVMKDIRHNHSPKIQKP